MKSRDWVAAEREKVIPRLYDHLFHNFAGYFWYRIRHSFVRAFFSSVLFILEFFFILQSVYADFAIPFFITRIFIYTGLNFLWGTIEGWREKLRTLPKEKTYSYMRRGLLTYRIISSILLGTSLAVVLYHILYVVGVFAFYHAYILFFITLIFTQIDYMVQHASIFIHQRLRKYVWPYIILDVFSTIFLFYFFFTFGPYSIPLMLIFNAIVRYIIHMYYLRSNANNLYSHKEKFSFRLSWPFSSMSAGLLRITGYGIPFLYFYLQKVDLTHRMLMALFVSLPLLAFSYNWTTLFYFDVKKMQKDWFYLGIHELYKKLLPYCFLIPLLIYPIHLLIQIISFGRLVEPFIFLFFFINMPLIGLLTVRLITVKSSVPRYLFSVIILIATFLPYNSLLYATLLLHLFWFFPFKECSYLDRKVPSGFFKDKKANLFSVSDSILVSKVLLHKRITFAHISPDIFILEKPLDFLQGEVRRVLNKSDVYLDEDVYGEKRTIVTGDVIRGCIEQNLSGTPCLVENKSYSCSTKNGFITDIYCVPSPAVSKIFYQSHND